MSTPFGTPPVPPAKPSGHSSGVSTPGGHRPAPPIPPQPATPDQHAALRLDSDVLGDMNDVAGPEPGWLPDFLQDKSTADLHALLASPTLQHALVHAPQSSHPSIPLSTQHLTALLARNTAAATSLAQQEQHLAAARQHTQSRLLAVRALERQWQQRQREQDSALREFSAAALYQRLAAAVGEQEALCHAMADEWLEGGEEGATAGGGGATEREVADMVRRTREASKVAYLRRERKERWDEGRIGGWRG